MKAVVAAFNQEKALVGAFSVIMNLRIAFVWSTSAGAPQKIMYLAEEAWRRRGVSANIHYRSALAVLFGVKKYADALWEVVNQG